MVADAGLQLKISVTIRLYLIRVKL